MNANSVQLSFMRKAMLCILLQLVLHTMYAQTYSGTWNGEGEYLPGLPITTVMKKMAAEKKLVFDINASGDVTGSLITTYNRSKASLPQEGDDQYFTLTGKYDDADKLLLLVVTHLKSRPDKPGSYLTFKKPDSVFYDLSLSRQADKEIVTGTANKTLNDAASTEWIGTSRLGGLGMNISDEVHLHLLPLRIRFEGIIKTLLDTANIFMPDIAALRNPINTPAVIPVAGPVVIRKTQIQRAIELDSSFIRIELYDNGIIDGDIATLILDGKTIVDKKLLSEKAATISLELSKTIPTHTLELFADNQGTIPPNTALVVITCKGKRYEINLSSTETVNGAVKLSFKGN